MRLISFDAGGSTLLAGILTMSFIGCGVPKPQEREFGNVVGKITFKGEPLTTGTVKFQPASGAFTTSDIRPDGTYAMKAVVGTNLVMVVSRETDTLDREERKKKGLAPPKSFIPEKFGTPDSGLRFDVGPSENTANFALEE